MGSYTDIVSDLQLTEPTEVPPLVPPFNEIDSFEEKFNQTFAYLQRNVRLKSRILSLTNAYFLGKLLNEIQDRLTRASYCQKLTDHYKRMAENTFDIFEFCPDQIQRTQTTEVQQIRKLSRSRVRSLREVVIASLAGART